MKGNKYFGMGIGLEMDLKQINIDVFGGCFIICNICFDQYKEDQVSIVRVYNVFI